MRIKKSDFIEFFNIIILLFYNQAIYIIPGLKEIITTVNGLYFNYLIIGIIIFVFFLILMIYKGNLTLSSLEKRILVLFSLYCIAGLIRNVTFYNQSISKVFSVMHRYFMFGYIVIGVYLIKEKGLNRYLSVIETCSVIRLLEVSIKWLAYKFLNIDIFGFIGVLYVRHGAQRIFLDGVSILAVLIAYCFWLSGIKKKWNFFVTCLGLFVVFFVTQTRALYVYILATMVVTYIISRRNINKKLFTLIVLIVGGSIAFGLGLFDSFIDSFSVSNVNTGYSTSARLVSLAYYLGLIIKNPLFGMGFINPSNSSLAAILHGQEGLNYTDDIGLIGTIAEGGIILLCLIVYILILGYKSYNTERKKSVAKLSFEGLTIFSLLFYAAVSFVSLSILDYGRTLSFFILISIIICLNDTNSEMRTQEC